MLCGPLILPGLLCSPFFIHTSYQSMYIMAPVYFPLHSKLPEVDLGLIYISRSSPEASSWDIICGTYSMNEWLNEFTKPHQMCIHWLEGWGVSLIDVFPRGPTGWALGCCKFSVAVLGRLKISCFQESVRAREAMEELKLVGGIFLYWWQSFKRSIWSKSRQCWQ